MKVKIIETAKKIYHKTSSRALRSFYYSVFCAMVRNRIVEATIDGIKYKLDLGESIDVAIYLNRYELDVSDAIKELCRPEFIVFDIGANIGAHTLRFADIVGSTGKVYAFEPTDYAYSKLVANVVLNKFDNLFFNVLKARSTRHKSL